MKTISRTLALAAMTSLCLSAPASARKAMPRVEAQAPVMGALGGQLVDASGAGIGGATFTVKVGGRSYTVTTDQSGNFFIGGVAPGTYAVVIRLPGGGTIKKTVTISGAGTTQLVVKAPAGKKDKAKPAEAKKVEAKPEPLYDARGRGAGVAGPPMPSPSVARRPIGGHPPPPPPPPGGDDQGSEDYAHQNPNGFIDTKQDKLSTFAADVDTASYTIVRRKLNEGKEVPKDAVRVEEFVNYFHYGYPAPTAKDRPFEVHVDGAPSPFDKSGHELLRIGVQGKALSKIERKPAHLVFLVDTSGSMQSEDKLPLAQRSLRILVDNLNDGDTVALVTYAGDTRVVLEPTGMDDRAKIETAIDDLTAGGGTAMASGISLAYDLAARTLDKHSNTRVIILSDGDANIGTIGTQDILNSIAEHVKKGITVSTVGFGQGNYKDARMEQLADKGNGNAFYIDSLSQAKRVFQEQLGGTLEVIAQDVKLQVELDPAQIASYRLVGYENRDIADQDFRNDKVDAGEIGAGHTVTAIYEVEWAKGRKLDAAAQVAVVRVRAKKPGGKEASEWSFPVTNAQLAPTFADASADFRFACAVMAFAEIMRGSSWAKAWQLADVAAIARAAAGTEEDRNEFVGLVGKAKRPG